MANNNNDFCLKKEDIERIFDGAQDVIDRSHEMFGQKTSSNMSVPSNPYPTPKSANQSEPMVGYKQPMINPINLEDPFGREIEALYNNMRTLVHTTTNITTAQLLNVKTADVGSTYSAHNAALHNVSSIISTMMLKRDIMLYNNACRENHETNDAQSDADSILVELNSLRNKLHAEANETVEEDSCDRAVQSRLNGVIMEIDDIIDKYSK